MKDKRDFTPGPWTAWDDDGTGTLPCVLSQGVNKGGNFYVAQCNVFEDARLIAAAPDLLAACEEVSAAFSECYDTDAQGPLAKARAAIAKALGQ